MALVCSGDPAPGRSLGGACAAVQEEGFSWGPFPAPLPGALGHLPLGHWLVAGKGVVRCQCKGSGPAWGPAEPSLLSLIHI